jgi:acetyltransferase
MAGLGGIWVEALGDVALRLAPVNEAEALRLLDELKGRALLTGARGQAGIDLSAFASLIAEFSTWVAGTPWLEELDLNPVIANADGFVVVDARMRASAAPSGIAASHAKH